MGWLGRVLCLGAASAVVGLQAAPVCPDEVRSSFMVSSPQSCVLGEVRGAMGAEWDTQQPSPAHTFQARQDKQRHSHSHGSWRPQRIPGPHSSPVTNCQGHPLPAPHTQPWSPGAVPPTCLGWLSAPWDVPAGSTVLWARVSPATVQGWLGLCPSCCPAWPPHPSLLRDTEGAREHASSPGAQLWKAGPVAMGEQPNVWAEPPQPELFPTQPPL